MKNFSSLLTLALALAVSAHTGAIVPERVTCSGGCIQKRGDLSSQLAAVVRRDGTRVARENVEKRSNDRREDHWDWEAAGTDGTRVTREGEEADSVRITRRNDGHGHGAQGNEW
ncbi:hypothetical protein B0H34DRAFT_795390 [Crassisporium funariophilum]|nr:hypothetical protein B0H34DRAFT_795390 [Crassisporium funariophilum]